MMLADTNILIYAHRPEADRHAEYLGWVQAMVQGPEIYAVSDFALNATIRVVTNPRIYRTPTPLEHALAFADEIRSQQRAFVVNPGPSFWPIFTELCRTASARGKLVPDAYLAALAIEHGCEFITADRDFVKLPGLRWRHPLD